MPATPEQNIIPPVSPSNGLIASANNTPRAVVTSAPAVKQIGLDQQYLSQELEKIKQRALDIQNKAALLPPDKPAEQPKPEVSAVTPDLNSLVQTGGGVYQDKYGNEFKLGTNGQYIATNVKNPNPKPQPEQTYLTADDYEAKKIRDDSAAEQQRIKDLYQKVSDRADASNKYLINLLSKRYDEQIADTKRVSESFTSALTQAGIRAGRNRYMPEIEMASINKSVQDGLTRVKNIQDERDAKLMEAQNANDEKQYENLFKLAGELKAIKKAENDAVGEVYKRSLDLDKAATERLKVIQDKQKQSIELGIKKAEAFAPYMTNYLTGDIDADTAFINKVAETHGYDPQILAGYIFKAYNDNQLKGDTTDLKEFRYAVQNEGYKGSFRDWQREQANLKATGSGKQTIADMRAGAISSVRSVPYDDPAYVEKTINASAGGELASSEERKALSKAFIVLNQIGDLGQEIQKIDTGPIKGILKSANPYDTKAQLIKAQLQSIIPTLARGVYGEVGVLTDNDIANYARTLPNLKSTGDVQKAVLAMTLKSIQRSVEEQLTTLAGSGVDVSGLGGKYKQLQNKAVSIEQDLGGSTGFSVTYNGKTYSFDSQEKLSQFREKLGIK